MRFRRYFDIRWSDLPWLALLLMPDLISSYFLSGYLDKINIWTQQEVVIMIPPLTGGGEDLRSAILQGNYVGSIDSVTEHPSDTSLVIIYFTN